MEAIERAKLWLEEAKWTVTQHEKCPPEITWMLGIVDENGRGLDIMQFAEIADVVFIQANIQLNPEHRSVINRMEPLDVSEFVWDLRMDLLKLGVDFNNLSEDFETLILTLPIAYDGMTKDNFLTRVTLVRRALLLYTWSIVRLVEQRSNARVMAHD